MDHIRAMRVFVRVAERGSLSGASDELGYARGAASNILKDLEQYMGVQLLERTTRKIRLTEEGRIYVERARAILADITDLEEEIGAAERRPRGRLRIQIPPGLTRRVVAPALPGFARDYPGIELEILSRSDLPDFVGLRLDAAVVVGSLPDLDIVARSLGHLPVLTVAAPAYLEARGTPRVPADLAGHDCLRAISTATGNPVDWRFRENERDVRMAVRGSLAFESPDAAVAAVRQGGGILQIGSYLVHDDIVSGRLLTVLDGFRPEGSAIHIVHPRHRRKPLRLKAFEDFLSDLNLHVRKAWNLRDTRSPGAGRLVTPSE